MFRIENNVPDVYIDESRDFQLLSRLGDLVFHCVKDSTESLKNVSNVMLCDSSILSLLSTKIGMFNDLDNIEETAHRKALSAFPYIIRHKGSMRGVQYICNLFEQIANTEIQCSYNKSDYVIDIKFINYISNIDLLKLLLEYVRPAGVNIVYSVIYESTTSQPDFVFDANNLSIDFIEGDYAIGDELSNEVGTVGFTLIQNVKQGTDSSNTTEDVI